MPREAVFLAYFDEQKREWVPVGGKVDPVRNVVTVETDHFSWWTPWTWNYDAWSAVTKKALSLEMSSWIQGVALLTEGCSESAQTVRVDNSKSNGVIKGCIATDGASRPQLRVVNLKSFPIGLAPKAGGPGCPTAPVLGPGDAARFTANTADQPPFIASADFTDLSMAHFMVRLSARALPGGHLIPSDGLAVIAEGLKDVVAASRIADQLYTPSPDYVAVAELTFKVMTSETFTTRFIELAARYGQEHGIQMLDKWTTAGMKQTFFAVGLVDVIASSMDFIGNYFLNDRSTVAFTWPQAKPRGWIWHRTRNSSIIQGDCLPRDRPQASHPHRLWGRAVQPHNRWAATPIEWAEQQALPWIIELLPRVEPSSMTSSEFSRTAESATTTSNGEQACRVPRQAADTLRKLMRQLDGSGVAGKKRTMLKGVSFRCIPRRRTTPDISGSIR